MPLRVTLGEALARYGFGHGHPFGPDRLDAFQNEFLKRGLDQRCEIAKPAMCTDNDLKRFHRAPYVEQVKTQSKTGLGYLDHGDTPAFPGVFEAASFVVGSVLDAVSWILKAPDRRAFVPIAGLHHARRESAAGFCVFNDLGIAIETLRAQHGIQRVAYVDIDAHHGDGVFYAFESDADLIFADLHEDGRYLYPGTGDANETGRGPAAGTKLNIPLPPGADDNAFDSAWTRVEDFVRQARPEFILLQAGADSVAGDPITHLAFSPACHGKAAARLRLVADEYGHGRLLATGGGGYNRVNLSDAWNNVVEALL
jgi:acetoin utilization protein AcuC